MGAGRIRMQVTGTIISSGCGCRPARLRRAQVPVTPYVGAPKPQSSSPHSFAYVGRRFVILHAYRKQSQKAPPQELALAERRLAEVLTGGIEDG